MGHRRDLPLGSRARWTRAGPSVWQPREMDAGRTFRLAAARWTQYLPSGSNAVDTGRTFRLAAAAARACLQQQESQQASKLSVPPALMPAYRTGGTYRASCLPPANPR
ncbi:hypothetical protein CDD83_8990 [Cordyceps sp. RAO-2017]|nr:hypothetical protein CDD83_8990 [Cordyceps sp. RAO-2017]